MSTPDPQHQTAPQPGAPQEGGPQEGGPQAGGPQAGGPQAGGPQRRQLSTDTIVVLVVVGVLFLALIVGGVF